jgi:hypothetical protein
VAVRAKGEGQERGTELVLSRSAVTGPPVRFACNRLYLARAAQLGFTELQVTGSTVPVVCRDERRSYTWVPLSPDAALPPGEDALRIASDGDASLVPQPPKERKRPFMTKGQTNGRDDGLPTGPTPSRGSVPAREDGRPNSIGIGDLIAETQTLKEVLRDGYERASRLLAALKRYAKPSEVVRSALASLRQLQGLGG